VLVLVVVLVLDLWDFGAEKRARSFGNDLFDYFDREIRRILEQEHEQDFSTSAFRFSDSFEFWVSGFEFSVVFHRGGPHQLTQNSKPKTQNSKLKTTYEIACESRRDRGGRSNWVFAPFSYRIRLDVRPGPTA